VTKFGSGWTANLTPEQIMFNLCRASIGEQITA